MRKMKKKVAVVGATGVAGQQFLAALTGHPVFAVAVLAASARSAGKSYRDAITDSSGALRWYCLESLAATCADMQVEDASRLDAARVDLVFGSGLGRRQRSGAAVCEDHAGGIHRVRFPL
jgi:aspartate-semialdehyde dehydrogenase